MILLNIYSEFAELLQVFNKKMQWRLSIVSNDQNYFRKDVFNFMYNMKSSDSTFSNIKRNEKRNLYFGKLIPLNYTKP